MSLRELLYHRNAEGESFTLIDHIHEPVRTQTIDCAYLDRETVCDLTFRLLKWAAQPERPKFRRYHT
jgi:hypothetical protein